MLEAQRSQAVSMGNLGETSLGAGASKLCVRPVQIRDTMGLCSRLGVSSFGQEESVVNILRLSPILILVSGVAWGESPSSDCDHFAFDPAKIDVGTVYHYVKSNIDGSHAIDITVYVASESDLEVLKIEADGSGGAYVTVNMNWRTFSPSSLLSWFFLRNGQLRFQARLGVDAERHIVHVALPDQSGETAIGHYPFHLYNFDFMSLNFAFRHLVDPEEPFEIGIADPDWNAFSAGKGSPFAYYGKVLVEYVGDEEWKGVACRKYRVGGPGLNDEFGSIWVNKEKGHFENVEHPWRDNPGWKNFKFELQSTERMTAVQWQEFMQDQVEAMREVRKALQEKR